LDDPTIAAKLTGGGEALRRILVVRLGAMGDVLHAMPAVDLLRQAQPGWDIGWVIESRWAPLLCVSGFPRSGAISPKRPLVNAVHVVDTRAWRKSLLSLDTYRAFSASSKSMRALKYDIAFDFQGSIKSAIFAKLSSAESIIGFEQPREYAASMFYSQKISTSMAHVVDQNFALSRHVVGDAKAPPRVTLPIDSRAEAWVTARLAEIGVSKFAILAPTAGWKAKEWPTSKFGVVAAELSRLGIASLINFGPGEERIAEEVRAASNGVAIPFACDLSQLIALTRRASLFIGGDTGPMHLAAALNVPVVALFGPTDPARNGPYTVRAKVLRSAKSVTSYSHVAERDEGLVSITPDEVLAAAAEML
jgi:heptosyltransferase-1